MDETEPFRRQRVAELNNAVQSTDKEAERKRLEELHGKVWDTVQLTKDFQVIDFGAPFVVVKRLSDGAKGSLEFQHHPRFYFNFQAA
jgi:pterin-4a-carbinolamine dehydratase